MRKLNLRQMEIEILQKNNTIVLQQKQIEELQKEKTSILKSSVVLGKLELNKVLKDLESKQINYKTLKSLYDNITDKNNELIDKCAELKEEIETLKCFNSTLINNNTIKIHNERGAGRKSKLTVEQLKKLEKLHNKGLSYKRIGDAVGISKAYAYKLIKALK
jgi:YesN/AraC family two-component response regulator